MLRGKKKRAAILAAVLLKSLTVTWTRLVLVLILVLGGLGGVGAVNLEVSSPEKTEVNQDETVDKVRAWREAFDLGLSKAVRSRPSFLKAFDEVLENVGLSDHVFKGTVKRRIKPDGTPEWLAGGVHSKTAIDNGTAQLRNAPTSVGPSGAGYYKAKVKVRVDDPDFPQHNGPWKSKTAASTFFPDSWSQKKIQSEIAQDLEDGRHTVLRTESDGRKLLGGALSDGVPLRIWKAADGTVETAFPFL